MVLGVHGCAVVDGVFVADVAAYQAVVDARPRWSLEALGQSARGVFCAYVFDPVTNAVWVLPDPWGGGLVHHARTPADHVISSDLGAVVACLSALGHPPRRSPAYATELAACGSGGLAPSSHEGVEVLDILEFAVVDAHGVHVRSYPVAEHLTEPFASYEEGLEAVRAEIEGNIAAIAASPLPRIAHLTGGADTRMVLGATLSQGATDAFRYLSIGQPGLPDKEIAERLAVEYDLLMTQERGSDVTLAPRTLREQARWPLDFSHGLVSKGPQRHQTASSTIIVSGGFGGYLKGNYSSQLARVLPDAPEELAAGRLPDRAQTQRFAEAIWGPRVYSRDPAVALYSADLVAARVDRLHELRLDAHQRGLDPAAGLDLLFMRVRNRYFVGETTRLWNEYIHRIDPLYCLSGARLALTGGPDLRRANALVLDLLRGWDPALPALPFDSPKVPPAYAELRVPIAARAFREPDRAARYDDAPPPPVPEGRRQDLRPATPEQVARARELRGPLWQVRDLDAVRSDLRTLVWDDGSSPLAAAFNRPVLWQLLTWPLNHRALIRQAFDLHAAVLWHADGTTAPSTPVTGITAPPEGARKPVVRSLARKVGGRLRWMRPKKTG